MTTYIQLADKLVEISGKVTEESIIKALGYKPSNGEFDEIKNNPIVNDTTGEYKIIDELGNIIAKFDKDGLHTTNIEITDTLETPNINAEIINVSECVTSSNVIATEDMQASSLKIINTITSPTIVVSDNLISEHISSNDSENLKIVDKQNNVILLADEEGISSTEFIAKTKNAIHKLSQKSNVGHTHGLLKLTGDVNGSALMGSNGATFGVTVVNDSHLHDSRYYTKSEFTEKGIPVLASPSEYFEIIDKKYNVMLKVDENGLRTTNIKLPSGDIQEQIDSRYTKNELSNDGVDYLKASVFKSENNAVSVMDKNNKTILNINNNGLVTTEVTAIDANGKTHKLSEKGNSPYYDYKNSGGILTESQFNIMTKYLYTPFIVNPTSKTTIPEDLLNTAKNGLFNEDYFWNVVKLPGGEPLIVIEWDEYNQPVKMKGMVNEALYTINRTDWTITPISDISE